MTVQSADHGTGTFPSLPWRRATFRKPKVAAKSAVPKDPRISALRRFAISITVLTVLGLTVLGFEEAYVTPVVAVATAGLIELILETIEALAQQRPVRYKGSLKQLADFLLPAYITGLACAMLLYANSELWPIVFATTVAVGSKYVLRVKINGRARHFLNPSNIGIVATLLLFHWVGIAPPYQFTEWVSGPFSWLIPLAILTSGTILNAKLTNKIPLIAGWVGGFALQAVIRTSIEHTAIVSALLVMTGTVFVLFTNYMITDPGQRRFAHGTRPLSEPLPPPSTGCLFTCTSSLAYFSASLSCALCAGRALPYFLLGHANRRRFPCHVRNPQRGKN